MGKIRTASPLTACLLATVLALVLELVLLGPLNPEPAIHADSEDVTLTDVSGASDAFDTKDVIDNPPTILDVEDDSDAADTTGVVDANYE